MEPTYLQQSNERRLPADYQGSLLLWDIDKTYLNTRFSSVWGLAAIPFEWAVDKQTRPGVVPLIRALRHGPNVESALVPLYFLSGSPPQLRRVIEAKMTLDGVGYDGITFKDQWGLVRAGRPRDVSRQVGYKLKALLAYRRQLPLGARWLMFGDDAEKDVEVFRLFGEVCSGLRGERLQARLRSLDVHSRDRHEIDGLSEGVAVTDDPVTLICIHQVKGPTIPPSPGLLASPSYLATAMALAERGYIRPEAITAVARAMRRTGWVDADLEAAMQHALTDLGVRPDLARYVDLGSQRMS